LGHCEEPNFVFADTVEAAYAPGWWPDKHGNNPVLLVNNPRDLKLGRRMPSLVLFIFIHFFASLSL
jgi:hypothetical protein